MKGFCGVNVTIHKKCPQLIWQYSQGINKSHTCFIIKNESSINLVIPCLLVRKRLTRVTPQVCQPSSRSSFDTFTTLLSVFPSDALVPISKVVCNYLIKSLRLHCRYKLSTQSSNFCWYVYHLVSYTQSLSFQPEASKIIAWTESITPSDILVVGCLHSVSFLYTCRANSVYLNPLM